ncbi:hypothetical protein HWV62_16218 [Athelia sp. TMB]|nr:hypothetical protein HWV62_16218 [Athelia sp. TMB]
MSQGVVPGSDQEAIYPPSSWRAETIVLGPVIFHRSRTAHAFSTRLGIVPKRVSGVAKKGKGQATTCVACGADTLLTRLNKTLAVPIHTLESLSSLPPVPPFSSLVVPLGLLRSAIHWTYIHLPLNESRANILNNDNTLLTGASASPASAPVGVNPECGILLAGTDKSLGNIANIVACALSMIFVAALVIIAGRRKAAVGRTELRLFLALYTLSLPLQLVTTGAFLQQGTTALVVVTAVHAGVVATLFWALLANGIVATQVVEDGTASSIIPFTGVAIAFFAATTYIALDTGMHFTHVFGPSNPLIDQKSIPVFVLTSIWPAAATAIYFVLMAYIVLGVLNEVRPMWFYVLSAVLFVLSQLDYFLLNKVICKGVNAKIDGSFVATLLETAAVGVLYLAWRSITEDYASHLFNITDAFGTESWEDEYPTYPQQDDYFNRN